MMDACLRRLPSAPGLLESGRNLDTTVEHGCELIACVGMSPSVMLREVLRTAHAQNRLTLGPYAAGKLMSERNLSRIMACILVEDGCDMDMNSVLIGAFCQENDIRLIKVNPLSALVTLLSAETKRHDELLKRDLKCLVIEHSKDGVPTTEDNLLMNYYQLQTLNKLPMNITLPS